MCDPVGGNDFRFTIIHARLIKDHARRFLAKGEFLRFQYRPGPRRNSILHRLAENTDDAASFHIFAVRSDGFHPDLGRFSCGDEPPGRIDMHAERHGCGSHGTACGDHAPGGIGDACLNGVGEIFSGENGGIFFRIKREREFPVIICECFTGGDHDIADVPVIVLFIIFSKGEHDRTDPVPVPEKPTVPEEEGE